MSLRRLGKHLRDIVDQDNQIQVSRDELIAQMKTLNDYMALMTDEPDPPTEHTDETT